MDNLTSFWDGLYGFGTETDIKATQNDHILEINVLPSKPVEIVSWKQGFYDRYSKPTLFLD